MLIELSLQEFKAIQNLLIHRDMIKTLGFMIDDIELTGIKEKVKTALGDPGQVRYRQEVEQGIRQSLSDRPRTMKKYLRKLDEEMPLPPAYLCEQH